MDSHEEDSQREVGPGSKVLRVVGITLAFLIIGIASVIAGFSVAQQRAPWQVIASAVTRPLAPPPQELFHKDHILVLVEGLDYDYTSKDEEYSTQARSDVIKAVNLDFDTRHVYALSIPRDMVATYPSGRQAKINEAQSEGGVHEAQAVISQWLGIPGFDRYMIFRSDSTLDLINALGGVDVKVMNSDCIEHPNNCTNGPLDYVDTWGHLNIHLKPGYQHLNGVQAVGYMRFRHDFCGDPCRIKRQDQVIHALISRLESDKLNTLLHVGDLLGVLNRDVETNLTRTEELSLAAYFAEMPKNAVTMDQVPYVADVVLPDGGDAIVPNETKRAEQVKNMLLDPPRPSPTPDASALAAINPLSVRVDVENGTGMPGMAKRVAALLRAKGFEIGEIGNASQDVSTTEVHEHTRIQYAGIRVRDALGKAAANASVIDDAQTADALASAAPSDVTVIVGQDFASALAQQQVPSQQ